MHAENPLASPISISLKNTSIAEVMDRAIYGFQASLFKLDAKLQRANVLFPPPSTRKSKLKIYVEETWKAWTFVLISLSVVMSSTTSKIADSANLNVAKLALASGNPDWECKWKSISLSNFILPINPIGLSSTEKSLRILKL